MEALSSLGLLLRDALRVERSQILPVNALRNTAGVVLPLAVGAATGHFLEGLTIGIGALNVAVSDRPAPYRTIAGRMLLAGVFGAVSVFVGCSTGRVAWLAVLLVILWGFAGGLLVALGATAAQLGVTGILLLLVFSGQPASPDKALGLAWLVLAGAACQTLLSVAAWPVRRFAPQRAALAELFRQLAGTAHAPAEPTKAPPVTAAISNARTILAAGGEQNAEGEALRSLLDEAERIRLRVLALADMRHHLDSDHNAGDLPAYLGRVLEAAGEVLEELAEAIAAGGSLTRLAVPLGHFELAAQSLRHPEPPLRNPTQRMMVATTLRNVEALGGQLRATQEIARHGNTRGEEEARVHDGKRPLAARLRRQVATLRANLTLHSTACRHALRLAGCLAIADTLAHSIDVSRTYWLPMSAAIILKPDFGSTFRLSLVRALATLIGLLIATGLTITVFTGLQDRIALVALFMFVMRALGPANYALLVIPLTALVVIFTSFAGAHPEATILERGIFTAAGGALALFVYVAWPTWERTQVTAILADLLDAYRRHFLAMMGSYLDPEKADRATMDEIRQAARLARSNAEASVERLRGEPVHSGDLDAMVGLLAASHRFARAVIAFEVDAYDGPHQPGSLELRTFVHHVDSTMQELSRSLRSASYHPQSLPELRADQRALVEAHGELPVQTGPVSPADYQRASITRMADQLTDSVNTMTTVLLQDEKDLFRPAS